MLARGENIFEDNLALSYRVKKCSQYLHQEEKRTKLIMYTLHCATVTSNDIIAVDGK